MGQLERLREYTYYFQFTLTGYGRDIEPNVPDKRGKLISTGSIHLKNLLKKSENNGTLFMLHIKNRR